MGIKNPIFIAQLAINRQGPIGLQEANIYPSSRNRFGRSESEQGVSALHFSFRLNIIE